MNIPPEVLKSLLASIKESNLTLIDAIIPSAQSIKLTPGEEVRGEILEQRANGRFLVRLGGAILDMNIPRETRVGSTVQLTYVSDNPRLTFALSSQPYKESKIDLSSTSRWLGQFAKATSDSAAASPLVRTSRLFEMLPADSQAIANRLREVVVKSGLFYESHLTRWADGAFQLDDILEEPQGQLSKRLLEGSRLPNGELLFDSSEQPNELLPEDASSKTRVSQPDIATNREKSTATPKSETTESPQQKGPSLIEAQQKPLTPKQDIPLLTKDDMTGNISAGQLRQSSPQKETSPHTDDKTTQTSPQSSQTKTVSDSSLQAEKSLLQPSSVKTPDQILPKPVIETVPTLIKIALPEVEKNIILKGDPILTTETQPTASDDPLITQKQSVKALAASIAKSTFQEQENIQGIREIKADRSLHVDAKSSISKFEPPDSQTLPIIKQQLSTLHNGQFIWQGEAWQGQPLEWKINQHGKRSNQTASRSWETTLKLDLPNLGTISADVRLSGRQVKISIKVFNSDSQKIMLREKENLNERMEGAGLQITGLEVRHADNA